MTDNIPIWGWAQAYPPSPPYNLHRIQAPAFEMDGNSRDGNSRQHSQWIYLYTPPRWPSKAMSQINLRNLCPIVLFCKDARLQEIQLLWVF